MALRRRYGRGAAAVFTMLLVVGLTASTLVAWHVADNVERQRLTAMETGRAFGAWLQVAHAATMRNDYRAALAANPNGFSVAPGSLPGRPPGLREPAGMTLGMMSDGDDVPMAWAVLVVDEEQRGPARNGAFESGLADVAVAGGNAGAMADHAAGVGLARGASVPDGALFATADLAVAYEEEVLYRRRQPGRAWANRMEAELQFGGNDLQGGARFEGYAGETTGGAESRGGAAVEGNATVAHWTSGEMEAAEVDAASMAITGRVSAGTGRFSQAVNAGSMRANARLDAGSIATVGAVDVGLLVVGGALDLVVVSGVSPPDGGLLSSTGRFVGRELRITGDMTAPATTARSLEAGTLEAAGVSGQSVSAAGGVGAMFGPFARINGTMTVGSCNGCR